MLTATVEQFLLGAIEQAWSEGSAQPFKLVEVSPHVVIMDRAALALALGILKLCPRCHSLLRPSATGWIHGEPERTTPGVQ
jgi:hypothetical protein